MKKLLIAVVSILTLAGCSVLPELKPQSELGDFALGHNIVIAPNPYVGPGSREATTDELIGSVKDALDARLDIYEGDKVYNIGLSIDGYVLADVGVPVVLAPKSALIVHITLWDDAAGEKLNDEAHQIAVLEDFSTKTIIGSGLFNTGDQQLQALSRKIALKVEEWLEENNEWFGVEPVVIDDVLIEEES
ncbi:MAG: hypothetical protein P8L68_04585 [Paracoccaceae bacterium]|nr:hypothetical protein [Paracoccaceae bacterium]MDG1737326.1 hypothetical protein [Paracoccaceae bacterium]MDG2257754.1 hypothetical protein [Paracoccaceae bacterium]